MKNNRLKFRVWDKAKKEYRLDIGLNQDGSLSHLCGDPEDDFTVERCTGEEDKNGKLIYEGDIVNLYPAETINHKERIVVWGRCGWTTVRKNTSNCNFGSHEIEVIGNIHEQEGAEK